MKTKNLIYIGIVIIVLSGSLFVGFGGIKNPIKKTKTNIGLSNYPSEEIPEECRMPEYENNVEEWKEHLSHHPNTLYCLNYYK